MLSKEFDEVMENIPVYKAVFRIKRVPHWLATHGVVKGECFSIYLGNSGVMVRQKDGHSFATVASGLEFAEYQKTSKNRVQRFMEAKF